MMDFLAMHMEELFVITLILTTYGGYNLGRIVEANQNAREIEKENADKEPALEGGNL